MRTLLLGRKMKATDAKTIQEIGIPSMVLMERPFRGPGSSCRSFKRQEGSKFRKTDRNTCQPQDLQTGR